MTLRKFFAQLLLLPVLAAPLVALAAPNYTVTFAPADFTAVKMNNRGQVAGTSANQPAIWNGDSVTTITALFAGTRVLGINNRGDIVGVAPLEDGGYPSTAFIYTRAAGLRYIELEDPWTGYSEATAVNDSGAVAGWVWAEMGTAAKGYFSSRRGNEIIESSDVFRGDWTHPLGMNRAGHTVGKAQTDAGTPETSQRAFLYRNGALKDLGTLGGRASEASDINDAGQIVGYSDTVLVEDYQDTPRHAFLYERGRMRDLGTLGGTSSYGNAINNAGVAVGTSSLPGDWTWVAFAYARGRMTDLNAQVHLPEGWRLKEALDINDKGQILAYACSLGGCTYARLTPRHGTRISPPDDQKELTDPDDADGHQ